MRLSKGIEPDKIKKIISNTRDELKKLKSFIYKKIFKVRKPYNGLYLPDFYVEKTLVWQFIVTRKIPVHKLLPLNESIL